VSGLGLSRRSGLRCVGGRGVRQLTSVRLSDQRSADQSEPESESCAGDDDGERCQSGESRGVAPRDGLHQVTVNMGEQGIQAAAECRPSDDAADNGESSPVAGNRISHITRHSDTLLLGHCSGKTPTGVAARRAARSVALPAVR
jgi:hypothetical protein